MELAEKTNRFRYKFRQDYLINSYLQPRQWTPNSATDCHI